MILIGAHQLGKSFTTRPLFKNLTFAIEGGERVGLIGPNGAGKSTLLSILAGRQSADEGKLSVQKGLRIGYLEQVPKFSENATLQSTVLEGSRDPDDWEEIARSQEVMAKLDLAKFGPDESVAKLSGGWKKRVALARELIRQPDLFLLDEPTNHLDIESILWLENLLANSNFATIVITHDRLFLQKISNRIIEIDRRHPNGLLSVAGDYASFLDARDKQLSDQERTESKLRNTLRRETEWLRRGAKARHTKQTARIDKTHELAKTVDDLVERNQVRQVRLDFSSMEKNPKKLIEAKGISKSYAGNMVIPPMDLLITPKSRLGLMGTNGSGKSTLIKLLTKTEEPDTGTVNHAERLKVSYFEQNRETLDQNITVQKTLCPTGDQVDYAGQRVHIKSYLSRFLFAYEQMDLEVRKLSGGEQSRLLLARLMLRESNMLVLDEPTNDLDMSTLDVLADVLKEFNGAVILVTHDRYFMDQVTNQILAFGLDDNGRKALVPMVGMDQWEEWHETQGKQAQKALQKQQTQGQKKKKLSYKDQRELDTMEETIHKAEARLEELTSQSAQPDIATNPKKLLELTNQMADAQAEVDRLYARWTELSQ